jgi:hypothetical protein
VDPSEDDAQGADVEGADAQDSDPQGADVQGADEPGPPPVPLALDAPPAAPSLEPTVEPTVAQVRRRSRLGVVLAVLLAAVIGFVAGLAASEVVTIPELLRSPAAVEAERDTELIGLLEDVIRTEGVMLAFNDEVAERLDGVQEEAAALAAVAEAAGEGAEGLRALRPLIVARSGGPRVDDVRTIYLPHLDSWIDYLAALAEDPALLFSREAQQPYLLLINATAEAFRDALEELIDSGPSARAAELAERILDDGFRSEGPDPTV